MMAHATRLELQRLVMQWKLGANVRVSRGYWRGSL